jgi:hypothetical protein
MTDERIINIARALLVEADAGYQAEALRLGGTPDPVAIDALAARVVTTTLELFRREEVALGERELGLFLTTMLAITLQALTAAHVKAQEHIARAAGELAEASARNHALEAAIRAATPAPAGDA